MPFLDDPNEEDELDPSSTKPVVTEGESAFAGDSSGGASNVSSNPAATSSGNFTNLQDYLSGNQSGEKTMADNLAQDVNGAGNTAKDANKQYTDAANNVISSSPTGSKYNGPSDYSQLSGDALGAQTRARSMTTAAADKVDQVTGGYDKLGAYMKNQVKDPGYTSGENGLDSFLVGASDPGKKAISDAQSNWSDVGSLADKSDAAVGSSIDAQRAKADPVFTPNLDVKGTGSEATGFPVAKSNVPAMRTTPIGVANSGNEQVFNMPNEVKPVPAAPAPTTSASGGSSRMNRFSHGGKIEADEPYSGLLSKLRKK